MRDPVFHSCKPLQEELLASSQPAPTTPLRRRLPGLASCRLPPDCCAPGPQLGLVPCCSVIMLQPVRAPRGQQQAVRQEVSPDVEGSGFVDLFLMNRLAVAVSIILIKKEGQKGLKDLDVPTTRLWFYSRDIS
jgi:hypothetical protein